MRQDVIQEKYHDLQKYLEKLGSVAVAFSSGVDSTFLLRVAHDVLGDKAVAVTARSELFPAREQCEAESFCTDNSIAQIIFDADALNIDGFKENPANRCYLCKKAIFTGICNIADENGLSAVIEGSNMDDNNDYRPGMAAVHELGVKSPLQEVGLYKSEIRELSHMLKLSTWDKPSYACLASRFVYGETIDKDGLVMVDRAEQLLHDMGFKQVRVRIHGRLARIEVLPCDIERLMQENIRNSVADRLKSYGFTYVTVDINGYRTGSMNETLTEKNSWRK